MSSRTQKIVAEIYLYGTNKIGFGWLASYRGQILGDGEPKAGRSCTETVWDACDSLRVAIQANDGGKAGAFGLATVFAPGGQHEGEIEIGRPGYYGDIEWRAARVYVVDVE